VEDRQAISRFEREMRAVGKISHPNVVQAYDAREIDGMPVLIMEFVDGLDLAELVRRAGRLPVAEACELIRQTALALQCAHEHGLVHRDIKPSNIMLARSGEVKLLDLGLARFRSGGLSAEGGTGVSPVLAESTGKMPVPPSEEMTGTGQAMGTADYMAPEQAADSRTVDIRADLYSLGCTLYKLLSGQGPFSGPAYHGTLEKMHAHVHQPAPPIRQLVLELPEALAAIIGRLLAKDPAARFSTPAEVAIALAPWCVGADLPALFQSPLSLGEGQGEGRESSSPLSLGEGQGEGHSVNRSRSPLVSAAGQGEGSRSPKPQTASWGWRSIVAVVGLMLFVGGFCFAMGIMIRIKKDGQETAIEVPEGSTTRVGADGQIDVKLPGKRPSEPEKVVIEDMDVVRVTALDVREPMTWQWRVHLPKGHRYAWYVANGAIPASGIPVIDFSKHTWACISQEPYWKTGLDAVLTAALRRIDHKSWALTVDARPLNTRWNLGSGSAPIPDAALRPMLDAGSIEYAFLGKRGTETLRPDQPIILLMQRAHDKHQPSTKAMPGFMTWLQSLSVAGPVVENTPSPASQPVVSVSRPVIRQVSDYEDFTGQIEATKASGLPSMYVVFDADSRTVLKLRRMVRETKDMTPKELFVLCGLVDDNGFPYRGKLESIDIPVDPKTGTARWRALLPNPKGILIPGLFARVRLVLGAPRKAMLIPDSALGTDQGRKFVYVVSGPNVVEYRLVNIGQQDDGWRVVENGLTADDWVVTSGVQKLRPGIAVKPERVPLPTPLSPAKKTP